MATTHRPTEGEDAEPEGSAARLLEARGRREQLVKVWRVVRGVLTALEVGLVLAKHEALAEGARALVVFGDMIFSFGRR